MKWWLRKGGRKTKRKSNLTRVNLRLCTYEMCSYMHVLTVYYRGENVYPLAQGSLVLDEVKEHPNHPMATYTQHTGLISCMSSLFTGWTGATGDRSSQDMQWHMMSCQASYVLLTLWCAWSHFRPWWNWTQMTVNMKSIDRILMDSLHQFHACGFETVADLWWSSHGAANYKHLLECNSGKVWYRKKVYSGMRYLLNQGNSESTSLTWQK